MGFMRHAYALVLFYTNNRNLFLPIRFDGLKQLHKYKILKQEAKKAPL
jgi:hypothetical protein